MWRRIRQIVCAIVVLSVGLVVFHQAATHNALALLELKVAQFNHSKSGAATLRRQLLVNSCEGSPAQQYQVTTQSIVNMLRDIHAATGRLLISELSKPEPDYNFLGFLDARLKEAEHMLVAWQRESRVVSDMLRIGIVDSCLYYNSNPSEGYQF